jgi:ArsR family transcriptional regulator
MDEQYIKMANVFKALSDPKRVQILDLLSDGEVCACILLEHFHISQPTLSYDMKVLIQAGVVKRRREGQRVLYSIDIENLRKTQRLMVKLLCDKSGSPGKAPGPET